MSARLAALQLPQGHGPRIIPEHSMPMKGFNIALWLAQVLLALGFALAGSMKVMAPASALAPMFGSVPIPFIRFIGTAEIAAVLGLLLPSLTRILPKLTPLAAVGLLVVMISAIVFHVSRSE